VLIAIADTTGRKREKLTPVATLKMMVFLLLARKKIGRIKNGKV
jgi:hypothetical protein